MSQKLKKLMWYYKSLWSTQQKEWKSIKNLRFYQRDIIKLNLKDNLKAFNKHPLN